MTTPTDSRESTNSSNQPVQPVLPVATSSLLPEVGATATDSNSYGATYFPYGGDADEFLPLEGTKNDRLMLDGQLMGLEDEDDPDRPPATSLIYLCALSSSLTSVLLGYGKRRTPLGGSLCVLTAALFSCVPVRAFPFKTHDTIERGGLSHADCCRAVL